MLLLMYRTSGRFFSCPVEFPLSFFCFIGLLVVFGCFFCWFCRFCWFCLSVLLVLVVLMVCWFVGLLVLLVLCGLVELESRQVGCYYSPSRIRIDGESVSELPHLFECLAVARIAVDRYDVVVVVLIRVA